MITLERSCDTDSLVDRVEIYKKRMESLGWTAYQLAQEIAKIRQARGEDTNRTKIQSSIDRALKEPDGRASYINDDIVKALGGEIVIRWQSFEEVKL